MAIARAVVHAPALILADEPTGNLDPDTAERVLSVLVAQVRDAGAACLLVTHSLAAAERADRVLRLTPEGIAADAGAAATAHTRGVTHAMPWQLLRLSWREWAHHPWRHGMALLAVALGVALACSVHLINARRWRSFPPRCAPPTASPT